MNSYTTEISGGRQDLLKLKYSDWRQQIADMSHEIRITQIIINILTNAVKYTEKGKVTFSVKGRRQDNDELALEVSVKDTGIGIKKEDLDGLFEEFTRLDVCRNHNVEGTGLGMSIVVHLLRQMGSDFVVESEYGEGSTFSFTLVQKIVDDAPMGDICLAKNDYQLVLMEHFMPNMDGIETLHRMKEMGDKYCRIPVIALTANVLSGARENYQSLGFQDFLEKPINVDKMEEVLIKYIPQEFHD